MAQLPDGPSLGERPVPQDSGAVASYEPPNWRQVGLAGQEISGAGRDLEEAANTVATTNDRQDGLVAQAASNSLQATRTQQQYDPKTGFANVKEGGAVGQQFIDTYTQKFTDSQTTLRDGLANDNQKRIFDQHAGVQALQFKSALLQHQAQQTDAFNDSTANNSVELALRGMAQRPTDELNFQTGLAQIDGVIDQTGKRKGLPDAAVAETKAKYFDAAYSTRILSLSNGVPGAVQANPYAAEAMFKQVQDKLGPQAQVTLGHEVQKAVQSVQARDTAAQMIYGTTNPLAPATVAPAIGDSAPLAAVVKGMESGGRETDADGNVLTSAKGAQGSMQVLPTTSTNPGFGVRPAVPDADGTISPEERARVGRDYLGAMTARYNNPALVMAAYNAGPGQVDKWIQQFGDPRTGAISTADFVAKIPFAETQQYVTNGLAKLGNLPGGAGQPTANQLKSDLYARVQAARAIAQQQYPGDTAYADSVASRVENNGRTVIANQQGIEAGARDGLFQGIVGQNPNGSDKPLTIDQLLADPQQKSNWNAATPETKLAIQSHFANGGGDPPRSQATQATVYKFMGMAANDREGFAAADLSPLIPLLPHADFDKLSQLQLGARNKADLAADRQQNLQHALTLSLDYALKPIGIGMPDKNTPQAKKDAFDQFTGRMTEALDNFKTANGKPANDQDIVKIAKGLTASVQVPGNLWGTNAKPGFQLTPEQEAQATVPMSEADKSAASQALQARYGFAPSDSMIQQAALIRTLHPNDIGRLRTFDQQMRAYASAQTSRPRGGL